MFSAAWKFTNGWRSLSVLFWLRLICWYQIGFLVNDLVEEQSIPIETSVWWTAAFLKTVIEWTGAFDQKIKSVSQSLQLVVSHGTMRKRINFAFVIMAL